MKLVVGLVAVMALTLGLAVSVREASAAPTANVEAVDVDPGTPGIQTLVSVPVGSTFRVDNVIVSVADAWQAEQINMKFDPQIVQYAAGPVDTNLGGAFLCGPNESPDHVFDGCARTSGGTTDTGVTRTWTFKCIATGTSAFHLQSSAEVGAATGTNFALVGKDDPVGDPVLHDASVSCGGTEATPAPATPEPTAAGGPTEVFATAAAAALTPSAGSTAAAAGSPPSAAASPLSTAAAAAATLAAGTAASGTPGNQTVTPSDMTTTAASGNLTATAQAGSSTSSGGGGGSSTGLIIAMVIVVVIVAVGGYAAYRWRERLFKRG